MSGDDAFFVARAGAVWACFLNGNPALRLGTEEEFWKSVETFYDDRHPLPAKPTNVTIRAQARPAPTPRLTIERGERRHTVSIIGKVFAPGGSREAIIADLSEKGCRFDDYSGLKLKPETHLTIRIGTVGPVPAVVRWASDSSVGILFDTPLHPSVLEHIRLQFGRPS